MAKVRDSYLNTGLQMAERQVKLELHGWCE